HPQVRTAVADLAAPGGWEHDVESADVIVQLHAQIAGKGAAPFERNNIEATRRVLAALRRRDRAFLIHASSSVVHSKADDDYTKSKKAQDRLVLESGVPYCILRPTLMF